MADYIVAIDLGTSHLTGIVGEKNKNGTFSIIGYATEDTVSFIRKDETEDKTSCIHRGIIYNLDNTSILIDNLLRKLETYLKGEFIEKVYIGAGGQSLHTIDHLEALDIADGATVTEEDIALLKEQCGKFKPNLRDVLDMATPVYYLDGRKDNMPVGVSCSRLEAHYKLIVGRSTIRQKITKSVESTQDKSLAGILISPLALADAVLSPNDKKLGCAFIDFGAGVTSVSVYEDGDLKHLCVVPFGGKLITRDIVSSLKLSEEEAEKYKINRGSAIFNQDDEKKQFEVEMGGSKRKIDLCDLNAIIEGRAKEIVENVYARIYEVIEPRQLGAGIILAGCAAQLNGLPEMLKDKFKVSVRYSTIRNGLVQGSDEILGNPLYMTAISLMLKGKETCVSSLNEIVQEEDATEPIEDIGPGTKNPDPPQSGRKQPKPPKPPKPVRVKRNGFKDMIKKIYTTQLFNEE